MSKWKKKVFYSLCILILLPIILFTTVDITPLKNQQYYKESKKIISEIKKIQPDSALVEAGWSEAHITPNFPVKVIGFGKNNYHEKVLDSIFVRSIVFKQGKKNYLYLAYDLLIVHPFFVKELEKELEKNHIFFDGIFYAATHTHNAIGSYADKIGGYFSLGGKDQKVIDFLINQTIESVRESIFKLSKVDYTYRTIPTSGLVGNRLNKVNGGIDSNLRVLFLRNESKKVMALITYAAHATCLPRKLNMISADYPGALIKGVNKLDEIDFAIFSAGAVASHEPLLPDFSTEIKNNYANNLINCIKNNIPVKDSFKPLKSVLYYQISLPLRTPHLKVGRYIRLRPFIFEWILGKGVGKLSFLKMDDVCFIGTPCDFSGELMLEIEKENKANSITPIITSFNGEYIGYITSDKYYYWDAHEVRDVNWFGPYNGKYFKESILESLLKIE